MVAGKSQNNQQLTTNNLQLYPPDRPGKPHAAAVRSRTSQKEVTE
jgi:hypothetical protein